MNKKILLLLVIACMISAIALYVNAGPSAGPAGAITGCGIAGCTQLTPTAITGLTVTAIATATGSAVTLNTVSVTTTGPAFNMTNTSLPNCTATGSLYCDIRTENTQTQNVTVGAGNATYIALSAASPPTAFILDALGIYTFIARVTASNTFDIFATGFPTVADDNIDDGPSVVENADGTSAQWRGEATAVVPAHSSGADGRLVQLIVRKSGATERTIAGSVGASIDDVKITGTYKDPDGQLWTTGVFGAGINTYVFATYYDYLSGTGTMWYTPAAAGAMNPSGSFSHDGTKGYVAYSMSNGVGQDPAVLTIDTVTNTVTGRTATLDGAGTMANYPTDRNGVVLPSGKVIEFYPAPLGKLGMITYDPNTNIFTKKEIGDFGAMLLGTTNFRMTKNPENSDITIIAYPSEVLEKNLFLTMNSEATIVKAAYSMDTNNPNLADTVGSTISISSNNVNTTVWVASGGQLISTFLLPFSGKDVVVYQASGNQGTQGSYDKFVIAGNNGGTNDTVFLDYFNTSLYSDATNPNGTMNFTTNRIVAIQTIAPNINILNFQLRWQNFSGYFDTTTGQCIGCTYDAMGTCQAEVEKIWGMFQNYNLTINLTPDRNINMQNIEMCCRDLNTTIALNSNCTGLVNTTYGATTWSDNTCFTPTSWGGQSYNTSDTVCIYLNLTTAGIEIPLGSIQPSANCEMIACEINGTWNTSNDKTFTINKTIKVTAI